MSSTRRRLDKMSRKQSSSIWMHFSLVEDSKAKCDICDMAPPCGIFTMNPDQTLKSSPHMSNEVIINISE